MTLDGINDLVREEIVSHHIDKAMEAVKAFSINRQTRDHAATANQSLTDSEGEIGERELRKIINQTMIGVSLFYQNCFIESLSK